MKRSLKAFFTAALLSFSSESLCAPKSIAITQIVEHPSLNSIREGITETLQQVFGDDLQIHYENAQGNTTIAAQIAQKFSGMELDLIIPISTPSAQTILNASPQAPVLFAAVTDPVEAHIVESLQVPGENRTGVMDHPPLERQIDLMLRLQPRLKRLGYLYNPGEANSVATLTRLKRLAKAKGIAIVPSAVSKSADVALASQTFVGAVDAIFIGNDNTVVSGLEALIKVCDLNGIPLYTSDPDSVKRGAYAALAYDQKQMGRLVGKIAVRILQGERAGDIPIRVPEDIHTTFNAKTAKRLNLPDTEEGGLK